MNEKTGKEVFLEAITEMVELLPVDWDEIDTNPAPAPNDPVSPNEKAVGHLADSQKVIWSVLEQITNNLQTMEDGTPLVAKLNAARKLTKDILFFLIDTHFGVYDGQFGSSGIRRDYQVVVSERQLNDPLLEMLE